MSKFFEGFADCEDVVCLGISSSGIVFEIDALLAENGPGSGDSAILKDEDRCIRCALCAQRCPTHAITMERFLFRQEWTYA